VPAATHSALDTMEDQKTRARVAAVLATPEMQQAMQELSGGLSQGVVNGLTSDQMTAQTDKLVGRFIHSFMRELARGLDEDLAPAMGTITSKSIDSAMESAMSPAHQQQIDRFSAAIVSSVMRGAAQEIPQSLAPAMRKAMTDDLGPALADMMRDDLTPGMAQMFRSPEFKAAFAETAHDVARQAVIGSNDALAELAEKKQRAEGGTPLGSIGAFFSSRMWLLGALIVVVALGVPILWLVRERQRSARYREQAERRNARAAALLGAMEAAPDGAWSSRLLEMLREQLLEDTTQTKVENAPPPSERHDRPHHA
jgi:hypothetical protein